MVDELTQEAEIDRLYLGKVKRITDFGAFVEIFPGTDGLIHISHLAEGRVEKVTDVVTEGDEVLVKCIDIDPSGRIRLSRKEALADAARSGARRAERGGGRPAPVAVRIARMPGAEDLPLPELRHGGRGGPRPARRRRRASCVLAPGERALVPTGFAIELPRGLRGAGAPAQRARAAPRHRPARTRPVR